MSAPVESTRIAGDRPGPVRLPELLAPASEASMVVAAAQGGADAVYFGVSSLNMRMGGRNFQVQQLPSIVGKCHGLGLRAFLTVNTIVFDEERSAVSRLLDQAAGAGVDAVIAWDPFVVEAAADRGLELHLSTQASVANSGAAAFWKSRGVSRVILARELSIEQIAAIKRNVDIELECFVHGAMCLALSGRCLLSHYTSGCSGNRGRCVQPCRREYEIRDVETGDRFKLGDHYVLSPRDLCALPFIDLLMEVGIDCFKIEGRNRSPEYVRVVSACFREAMEAAAAGVLDQDLVDTLAARLATVYNRGFSDGFYFGLPADGGWAGHTGSAATHRKVYVGKVEKFYKKISVAVLKLHNRAVSRGEELMVIGPTTGVRFFRPMEMQVDHADVDGAGKGERVAVKCPFRLRSGDKVFIFEKRVESSPVHRLTRP